MSTNAGALEFYATLEQKDKRRKKEMFDREAKGKSWFGGPVPPEKKNRGR